MGGAGGGNDANVVFMYELLSFKNGNAHVTSAWRDNPQGTVAESSSSLAGLRSHSTRGVTCLMPETKPTTQAGEVTDGGEPVTTPLLNQHNP